ncbi:DUF1573 domain-containing protein [bacterium]|nr:DUF1573 domain-containing protein [bacterium]
MSEPSVSLGAVEAGGSATRELVLGNRGDASLTILSLRSLCRCLSVEISDATLAPGATATLTLAYRARVHPGTEEGEILIRTDDPLARQVRLRAAASVYLPVMIEPEVFHLRAARRGQSYAQPFTLIRSDKRPLAASVSGRPAGVRVDWAPRDAAMPHIVAGTVYYLVPATAAAREMIQRVLEFSTDCPDRPVVPLSLSGYVAGAFSAEPERLNFGVIADGSPAAREFALHCEPPHRLDEGEGIVITTSEPRLSIQQVSAGSDTARFRVTLFPSGGPRELRARLRVAPPARGLPSLEIPVRAVIAP